jgi:hypothetical protein
LKPAACPLCGHRKGKRPCPAKGAAICSPCCGTKRHVEVDCPPDCVYLTGSHAATWDGRERDRRQDLARVAPHIEALTQDQAAVFFYLVAGLVRVSAAHREADDGLWREAVRALHKTLETRESGLVYEHPAEDWRAQGLVRDLQGVITPPENEGQAVAEPALLRPALGALAAALEATAAEGAGPRAFLETAARLAARIQAGERKGVREESSRLVEP